MQGYSTLKPPRQMFLGILYLYVTEKNNNLLIPANNSLYVLARVTSYWMSITVTTFFLNHTFSPG